MEFILNFVTARSEVDLSVFLVCGLCWGLGGIVNGIIGFGPTTTAAPLIAMVMPLRILSPVITLTSWTGFVQVAWEHRREADWRRVLPLLLGIIPGAFIGVNAVSHLPEPPIRIFMGLFLVSFALWKIVLKGKVKGAIHKNWGLFAGTFSSAIGSVFGMGGPPIAVYGTLTGWPKDAFKVALGLYFTCANVIIVVMQMSKGLHTMTTLMLFLFSAPFMALGVRIGIVFSRRVNQDVFAKIIYCAILLMGCNILYRTAVKFWL